jgi:cytochrome d ubiquinol oxidase subunit I
VNDLLAARLQMAVSLGFHIVFACIGMTMPWLMAAAEWRWLRHGDARDLALAKAWAKGVAVLFAVGAVSGTVLSFELGLLWPTFMKHAGPIIGLPFSWEGAAFFLEAIALGLFLYGWDKLPPRVHFASGIVVGLSGVASGVLVVAANAWMNSPAGVRFEAGQAHDIDPVAAMFNDAWFSQALHMTIAAFEATGFLVAGVHALRLLRRPELDLHRRGLRIALLMAACAALLQPLSGDLSAKDVAQRQPAKLAAMEGHYHTQKGAPLSIGGLPDDEGRTLRYALEIPNALSILAFGDPDAEVMGLDRVPREFWPPTLICHLAFQTMVGCGSVLAGFSLFFLFASRYRPGWLRGRAFLYTVIGLAPLGFLAVEAGWTVTEVGRQPWIIYQVMLTRDAVTPMPGLQWTLLGTCLIYAVLATLAITVMSRLIRQLEQGTPGADTHG